MARTSAVMPLLGRHGHAVRMISLRRGTVGVRFTVLYAAVFLVSGVGLLGLTFLIFDSSVSQTQPVGNQPPAGGIDATQERLRALEEQLTHQSRQLLIGSL